MNIDIIQKAAELSRVTEIKLKDKVLSTPAYFPSISSYGIKLPLSYLIYLLANFGIPRLLISAYDMCHEREKDPQLLSSLEKYRTIVRDKKKGFLFVDSGIYEASWYKDPTWDIDSYRQAIMGLDFDFYSSYDIIPDKKQSDSQLSRKTFNSIELSVFANKGELVPILHGHSREHLVSMVDQFLNLHFDLCGVIGIPERDCGNGILEKAHTIKEIRKTIENHGGTHILHVLGCGDPLAILLYSYYGADAFDSLDWYEHVVNPKTYSLEDSSHFPLFECQCKACAFLEERAGSYGTEYKDKALIHNLFIYQEYMKYLQELIRNNGIATFVKSHFVTSRLGENIEARVEKA